MRVVPVTNWYEGHISHLSSQYILWPRRQGLSYHYHISHLLSSSEYCLTKHQYIFSWFDFADNHSSCLQPQYSYNIWWLQLKKAGRSYYSRERNCYTTLAYTLPKNYRNFGQNVNAKITFHSSERKCSEIQVNSVNGTSCKVVKNLPTEISE